AGEDAEIILGTVLDESFDDELRVTVIATGFDLAKDRNEARVAPNKKMKTESKASQDSDALKMPTSSEVTGQSRYPQTGDKPYYKGEKNLKNMDQPAIHRRGLKNIRSMKQSEEKKEEPNQNEQITQQQKGEELLNNRRERIDKSDSEQPAFLRKIMD